jgi:hypothetical protein
MTRWATSPESTAAAAANTALRILVDLDFASGHVYAHAGNGNVVFAGNTYLGLGTFGGFDQITEQPQSAPKPVTLTLAGIPTELVASAMNEVYQGRAVTLYRGLLDGNGAWIGTPAVLWSGVMDTMKISLAFGAATIALVCEDPDYAQPPSRRYTSVDLQADYPGDLGLEYLPAIMGFRGNWGAPGYGYGSIGGAPGNIGPGGSGHPGRDWGTPKL